MSDSHAPTVTNADVTPEEVEAIRRRRDGYLKIGLLQVVCAVATIAISYAFVSTAAKAVATLVAASVNATLVAGIMMHLKEEKRTIWNFLIVTAVFFFVLFFLISLAQNDPIVGTTHTHR